MTRLLPVRALVAGVAWGLLAAAGAGAQTVVGAVVEEGTGQPLEGAFVQLQDSAGVRHGGVLSGADGDFVIRAPAPGRYRIIAELIGYADPGTIFVTLAPTETVRLTLGIPVRAVTLGAITAQVGERCRPRPGAGTATARLWEEARKALEVTRWAEMQNVLRFHIIEHVRRLDARSLEVLSTEESGWTGFYDQSPYASRISAERLAGRGYVQPAEEGWDFFAPDARVLLSESFLDTHCFRVAAPSAQEPDLVGLGFEPVPGREAPDIQGVLWLDEGTAELRRVDFSYVALPFEHGNWPQVGGRLEFERLATGMWIIRRWHVRMPVEATRGDEGRGLRLTAVREEGAEVRNVWTRDGTRLAEATGATVFGTAIGPDGEPLAGARVSIPAARVRTLTGEDGGYRLSGLPEGTWAVELDHPLLELVDADPVAGTAHLEAGRAIRLPFRLAFDEGRARSLCTAQGWDPDRGSPVLVYGRVLAADGGLVPGGLVRLALPEEERRVVADGDGAYRTCLTPSPEPLGISAWPRSGTRPDTVRAGSLAVDIAEPGFVRADLTAPSVRPPPTAPDTAAALVGRVLDQVTERPVPEANVVLRDTTGRAVASQVTDDLGRFRIPHPGAGARFDLGVEHVAYAPSRGGVRFPAGEQVVLDVLLARQAIPLEPIVVRERRRGHLVDVGFYARRDRGFGVFVDRAEIERRSPTRITDLLRGRAGLRVVDAGLGQSDVRILQQVSFQYAPDRCRPAVWIDGGLAREGGAPRTRGDSGVPVPLSAIISPEHVEGMEVYTGTAGLPPDLAGANAPCGVVLIWTRRPDPRS